MSAAAVMLPLALTGSRRAGRQASSAETGRDGRGGGGGGGGGDAKRSRCNVSAVHVSAGLSGCIAGRARLASSNPILDLELCFIHTHIYICSSHLMLNLLID